jgi:hypothetical protein
MSTDFAPIHAYQHRHHATREYDYDTDDWEALDAQIMADACEHHGCQTDAAIIYVCDSCLRFVSFDIDPSDDGLTPRQRAALKCEICFEEDGQGQEGEGQEGEGPNPSNPDEYPDREWLAALGE